MKNDVSGKKVIFNPVYAAVIAVTIAFVLFMSLADVKAEDFTFLDIRQKIMSQISVKFKDEGFEAFVRSEFDLGDKKITRADLEDKTGLFFTREHQKEPIYSLDDIKYFPNLDFFYTGDRIDIAGNLDSFKYTPKIEFINVAKSNISGDIDVLASLESLSYFGCDWMEDDDVNRDRNIYGDIRVFKNLEKLKSIHLPDTDVYGDIQSLKGLDLEELVLAYTDVDGDISVCEEMKNLSQLNLDFSNISGDISSIKTLKELKYFTAASTLISGDIENLSELDLETLDLNETGVFGDISAFMDMKSMENLDVGGTDIKGDIVAFENMKNLWNILFWDTNIIGDISIFKDMTGLEFLGASQYVTGDISFLYDFEHLAQLETPMGSFFRDGAETDYTIEVDLNNIPNMVSSIVSDWQSLYGDVAINKEENSDIFISVSEEKEVGNGYSFTSINTPVDITLLTALDQDDGVNVKGNQAISMLFQTSTKNIYFSFLSKDSNQTIKVIFEEDGVSVLAPNADEQNIVTDEAFNFEESKLYVLFFAIDKNGLLKGVVWEFGKVEHIIYIDKDFAELEKAKEFQNQSWTFAIGTLEPSTMTIVYYTAYKFEQYAPS
ncbi:MAG: hypothetical protein KAQ68_01435 [Clostridiales bacterium]|nr:hypothetical protein [Clostridiales bacterium]